MAETGHSDVTTEGIRVRVAAEFLPEESDAEAKRFAFVYRVVIDNVGVESAKLLARHWIVTDALGETRHVRGPGVVGQQPDLEPGASFEYKSGCELPTAWGTMEGRYLMLRPSGEQFGVEIGRFFLAERTAPMAALDRE